MKKLYLLLLLAIFSENIFTQNYSPYIPVMTAGTPMTTGVRYPGSAGYSTNDSAWVYVLGGLQDGNAITNTVYRYNVLADSWSTLTNFPDGSYWISAAAVMGNKLYSLGGTYTLALNECTPRVKIYNLATNTWSDGANMPFGRVFHSVTVYQDSLLYCAGGWGFPSGTVYNDVYLYNSISNTWRPASNMPAPRCGGVLAAAGDTLVYVCGGPNWTNPSATNSVFRGVISQSDRSVITWDSTGAVYPAGVRNSIYGAAWGNKGVVVSGGYQISSVTSQCYVYSPGANTWTLQPALLAPKTDHGAASVHIGSIWKFISVSGTSNRSANSNTVNILTDTMTGITGIVSTSNNIPQGFSIKQNYPNPFNPVTTINFSVASGNLNSAYTSLIVYDIMGREVERLFTGDLVSGDYSIQWNAENNPSGTYFAKLISGSFTQTIKLVLTK
jgi:N-acetylneuraminic acid mutarotase